LPTTGGMGKSTLADQVYREMATMPQFISTKHMTFEMESNDVDSTKLAECHKWIKIARGPVLLYLDNIQSKHQLDSLLPDTLLPVNSFVLITSRIQGLVPASNTYDMPIMSCKDALALFRWHVYGCDTNETLANSGQHVSSTDTCCMNTTIVS
jgi:hypothetical protein